MTPADLHAEATALYAASDAVMDRDEKARLITLAAAKRGEAFRMARADILGWEAGCRANNAKGERRAAKGRRR